MALLQHFLDDAIHGVKDSMSGWWVAVKCWQEEARLIQDKPPPPQAFSDLAKKRAEQRGGQVDDDEGSLSSIVWNTVTTAGVALLITFLIQTVCSFIASLFGETFGSGLYVSTLVLQFLWWFPSMAVIKLTSIINNNEVADKVFLFKYGKPRFIPIGSSLSEFIFSCIYQTVFMVQAEVVCMLVPWPWVSRLLEWLHYSLFYALYAFEYKWASLGIPGHTRVAQIENNCPYYFAFGLPIHFIISYWGSLYTRYRLEDPLISQENETIRPIPDHRASGIPRENKLQTAKDSLSRSLQRRKAIPIQYESSSSKSITKLVV
ncbi:etoposide-induced protein 2.4 [Elysia marginata]|uniref:Etoposide-induced protein 2.4 n=1 Tax=Elysia marginata TaxID=1093978 RepID=A0AAV4EJ27_9GAST|nr:etoposide-induced protein 2.4 [Elysia marginata]